jgi:hypothetical protein
MSSDLLSKIFPGNFRENDKFNYITTTSSSSKAHGTVGEQRGEGKLSQSAAIIALVLFE